MVPWHSSGERWERSLIRLLLSKYEKGAWSSAEPDWPEDRLEGAVDAVVTLEARGSIARDRTRRGFDPPLRWREGRLLQPHFHSIPSKTGFEPRTTRSNCLATRIYVNFPVCALPDGVVPKSVES